MLPHYSFYLGGIYIFATTDDHIFDAAGDVEIAFLIRTRHVTRMEPTVLQGLLRRFRIIPIPCTHMRTLNNEFSRFANRHISSLFVHQPHLAVKDRLAYRPALTQGILVSHRKAVHANLCQSIALAYDDTFDILPRFDYRRRAWRAAADTKVD